MQFIKKNYMPLIIVTFIITMLCLSFYGVVIPAWGVWLIVASGFGFASWRLFVAFRESYRKAKTHKERNQVIITACIVCGLGIVFFCGVHFSGMAERLFPVF